MRIEILLLLRSLTTLYFVDYFLSLLFLVIKTLIKLLFKLVFSLLNELLLLIEHISLKLYLVLFGDFFGLSFFFDLAAHPHDLLLVLLLLVPHVVLHFRKLVLKISLDLGEGGRILLLGILVGLR